MSWRSDPVTQNSGGLATRTLTSGTAAQVDTAFDRFVAIGVTLSPTAVAAATVAVAISPDNSTFTNLATVTEPATATVGFGEIITLMVPAGWWVKLTAANATIGTLVFW